MTTAGLIEWLSVSHRPRPVRIADVLAIYDLRCYFIGQMAPLDQTKLSSESLLIAMTVLMAIKYGHKLK